MSETTVVASLTQPTSPTIYTGIHNSNISLPFQCTVGLRNRHVRLPLITYEQAAHSVRYPLRNTAFCPRQMRRLVQNGLEDT